MKQWLLRVVDYITPRTNVKKQKSVKQETDVLVLLERFGCIYDDSLHGRSDDKR